MTATVGVGSFPAGVGVDAASHVVYVANGDSDSVSVITPQVSALLAALGQAVQGVGPGTSLADKIAAAQSCLVTSLVLDLVPSFEVSPKSSAPATGTCPTSSTSCAASTPPTSSATPTPPVISTGSSPS